MTFRNERLPVSVEQGANFKYQFSTTIAATNSGYEQRNINWSQFRLTADIAYPIQRKETLQAVIDHFVVMNGQAYSFPVKNWDMFRIGDPRTDTFQLIGVADGSTAAFQVNKLVEVGSFNFTKEITKLRPGGKVYLNGVLQTLTTHYTIDLVTGIITFNSNPSAAALVQYCGEFDFAMRYSSDALNVLLRMSTENYEIGAIPQIELIEVRGE